LPLTGASFLLLYNNPADKAASNEVLKFFDWSFKNGKKMAEELDYVALPDILIKAITERVWKDIAR